jgi:hypothetical protein
MLQTWMSTTDRNDHIIGFYVTTLEGSVQYIVENGAYLFSTSEAL